MSHAPEHDLVLVVDFGAQYAQLIARRVREARVYSEIVPHSMPVEEMLAMKPAAIILSGGPSSVYADGAPGIDDSLFGAGVPVFGMCYGFQLMAQGMGGTVAHTGAREYGRTGVAVHKGELNQVVLHKKVHDVVTHFPFDVPQVGPPGLVAI